MEAAATRTQVLTAIVAVMLLAAAACSSGGDNQVETGADDPASPTPTPLSDEAATGEEVATDGTDAAPADGAEESEGDLEGEEMTAVDGEALAFTDESKLTTVGIDEIFFGMSVDDAAEAASTQWAGAPNPLTSCYFVEPRSGPDGISFMIWDGFVERVDITNPILTTRSGAGVGSTEQELGDLFGAQLETLAEGSVLAFVPIDEGDAEFRIVFNLDAGEVTSMIAGRRAQVELESCPSTE